MALVTVGALTVQVSSTSQQPQTESLGTLAACGAKAVNGQNDPRKLETATEGVIAGVREANMAHLFRFGRVTASSAALVDGTQTVTLPTTFFAVAEVQLVDAVTDEPHRTLGYVDWQVFNDAHPVQDETGEPLWWTARNSFDEGALLLYPVPDAGAAASWKSRVSYFERIEEPSDAADVIDAPRELSLFLCTYAKYWCCLHHDADRLGRSDRFLANAMRQLAAFRKSTEREPTAHQGFRLKRAQGVW